MKRNSCPIVKILFPDTEVFDDVKPGMSNGRARYVKIHGIPANIGKIIIKPLSFLIWPNRVKTAKGKVTAIASNRNILN